MSTTTRPAPMKTWALYPEPRQVAILSIWRNDAKRDLERRAIHLLRKGAGHVRRVWVVGDSNDDTADRLHDVAQFHEGATTVVDIGQTGIEDRYERLSHTVNEALALVTPQDEYVLWHESDLVTPVNLVELFLSHAASGRCPIAGWPTLEIDGETKFYDVWAYRGLDGKHFSNEPHYHDAWRDNQPAPFEVASMGSCFMFHAEDVRRGLRCQERAVVELCEKLRSQYGRRIWVDPTIEVVQPRALFTAHAGAPE